MNINTKLLIVIAVTLISILGVLSFKGNDSDEQSTIPVNASEERKDPGFEIDYTKQSKGGFN